MFFAMTKRLFPICPLLAMLISCGKKAEEGNTSEVRRPEASRPVSIELEASATGTSSRIDHIYTILRDGTVFIPAIIGASGKTANLRVRLDMNILDGEEEFHCYWIGKGLEYEFDKCQYPDGTNLGLTKENISRFDFAIDQDKVIKLSLEAAPAGTTVKARLSLAVTWI